MHQLLALQLGQAGLDRLPAVAPAVVHGGHGARPEDPADHGRVLDQRPDLGGEPSRRAAISPWTVSGTGMSGMASPWPSATRPWSARAANSSAWQVAAGPLQQQGLHADGQHARHQGGHQPRHLEVGQRHQRDPGRGRGCRPRPGGAPAARGGPWPRSAAAGRRSARPGARGTRASPGRPSAGPRPPAPAGRGHGLHEPPPGGEQLGPLRLDRVGVGDPEQGASRARSHSRSGGRGAGVDGRPELVRHLGRGSDSRMPAWALTISPSAQKVIPSPYGSSGPGAR